MQEFSEKYLQIKLQTTSKWSLTLIKLTLFQRCRDGSTQANIKYIIDKDRNHVITSVRCRKSFWQDQTASWQSFKEILNRRNIFQRSKGYTWQTCSHHCTNGEKNRKLFHWIGVQFLHSYSVESWRSQSSKPRTTKKDSGGKERNKVSYLKVIWFSKWETLTTPPGHS